MCIRDRHKLDPMSYSVDLVRYALFGTAADDPRMRFALIVLVGLAVASWVVACVCLRMLRKVPRAAIHPELSV